MGPSRRLLVVDDEEEFVRLLLRPLARAGFAATCCDGVEPALAALRGGGFDGALIDVYLGGEPLGFGLLAAIRADPATAGLPVVSMSGAGEKTLERCLALGADAILPKPFTMQEFLSAFAWAVDARERGRPT